MRDVLAHDSRRVRLLAVLGIAAAFVLARAETSQASFSFASSAIAGEAAAVSASGELLCFGGAIGAGPCFYVAVTVNGGGRVESTEDPVGTKVMCPASGGHTCNVPEWFIWAFDVDNPFIDFLGIPTTGSWSGWGNCPHVLAPPSPNPLNAASRCRIFANELDTVDYKTCLTANFSGTGTAGGCDGGTPPPVGDPVIVRKTGSGAGGGLVQSTSDQAAPRQIHCGSTCSAVFQVGTLVTLFPNKVAGSTVTFTGWSGVGHSCSGTGACQITVSGQVIEAVANYSGDPPPPPPPAILNAVILQKPAKTTRKRTARFVWAAKRGTSFVTTFKSQCRLNKQVWKACSPPKTYRNLRAGRSHTFRVRVKDAKRNEWDKTPAVWTWRIRR